MPHRSLFDFTGRVCLVTGAGSPSGIGFAAARVLGLSGARIALTATTDRIFQREAELKALGIDAAAYTADLMDRDQAAGLVEAVLRDFGAIHILVNNAGMAQTGAPEEFADVLNMSWESWETGIRRNLTTCFTVIKLVLPAMVRQKYGRIVNVASVTGPVVSNPGEAAYSAGKAGILGLSRALAIETCKDGITVNSVLPGWIASGSQTEEEAVGGLNTPAGRSGTPEEVAWAVAFLASQEASYITGESLVVDGGNTIQEYKGPAGSYY